MTRDSQRERVYQSEFRLRSLYDNAVALGNPVVELDGISLTLPPEGKFGCVESVQRYVDRVVGAGVVGVRARRSTRQAHYEPFTRTIAVPDGRDRWAMREIVVLHELAHHLTRSEHCGVAAHGPQFVSVFGDLMGRVMGAEVQLAYRLLCSHEGAKERVR